MSDQNGRSVGDKLREAHEHLRRAERSARWATFFGALSVVSATVAIVLAVTHG